LIYHFKSQPQDYNRAKNKMKNLSTKQIEQVKGIKTWTSTKFHGNTKKVGALLVTDLKAIFAKKVSRELAKIDNSKKSNVQKCRELLQRSIESKGTGYFKVLIEGNTGIYYASPVYQHSDYNKSRVFEKNAETLRLMQLFNSIINKK
jgi:hypothetical protein